MPSTSRGANDALFCHAQCLDEIAVVVGRCEPITQSESEVVLTFGDTSDVGLVTCERFAVESDRLVEISQGRAHGVAIAQHDPKLVCRTAYRLSFVGVWSSDSRAYLIAVLRSSYSPVAMKRHVAGCSSPTVRPHA